MVNIDWNKTHVWKKKRKGPVNLLPSRYLACYNALLDLSRGRVHVLGRKRPNTRPYNEPNGLTALVLGPWQCVPKYTMRADWLSRLHIRTHMHVQLNAWSSCRTSLSISALESILYSHALETTPKKKKKTHHKAISIFSHIYMLGTSLEKVNNNRRSILMSFLCFIFPQQQMRLL